MGSSSAFTVGLLNAVYALEGRMVSSETLAEEGIRVEQEILKETVGSQDQVCAAYGGFNHICFSTSGDISVRPVILPRSRLEELSASLMLFYTGIKRTAADVADTYVPNLDAKKRQLRLLREMVDEALEVLGGSGSLGDFGKLIH
jgi:D-glycero-alpha-D-manno-heptose-7-phosphate kinase